mmetsp:Transcript_23541/g.66914  ORF Transcript_23541/g.66914 Transcript_23541/m.66914 type:complete len:82 (-) Transcript_23541:444-689(-)
MDSDAMLAEDIELVFSGFFGAAVESRCNVCIWSIQLPGCDGQANGMAVRSRDASAAADAATSGREGRKFVASRSSTSWPQG